MGFINGLFGDSTIEWFVCEKSKFSAQDPNKKSKYENNFLILNLFQFCFFPFLLSFKYIQFIKFAAYQAQQLNNKKSEDAIEQVIIHILTKKW